MKIPLNPESPDVEMLAGRPIKLAKLKAKHLIAIEKGYGSIGDVERGIRILSALTLDAMGTDGWSYDELSDVSIEELTPILEKMQG